MFFQNFRKLFSNAVAIQRRQLHLHEYQSKGLLRQFGLGVQRGDVASSPEEARRIAQGLKDTGAKELIVKCQVLAGGRGKGTLSSGLKGGVQICSAVEDVEKAAEQMIGYRLVTHQTTKEGEEVHKVLILEGVDILKEFYLAIVLDPAAAGPMIVASREGGVEIETTAATHPDAVIQVPIADLSGVSKEECLKVAEGLGIPSEDPQLQDELIKQIQRLYRLFVATDATTVEINPLALVRDGPSPVICIDAKLGIDDNAGFRQKDIIEMEDTSLLDPREREAQRTGVSFVSMDGNIGCLVNGAGLAMATMDIVKLHGGAPANFLDVGGGATVDQVAEGFKILQMDEKVKVIFVNIFGGIMRCDIVAKGIVEAARLTGLRLPLVVRLIGNRVEEGKKYLAESGLQCSVIDELELAAKTACDLAKGLLDCHAN